MTRQTSRGWVAVVAAVVVMMGAAKSSPAQKFETLFTFDGDDGAQPTADLVQGLDGNLYGSTTMGGANVISYWGTVFKISPTGRWTVLYAFCSQTNCPDGYDPSGTLVQTSGGELYGTTLRGGIAEYQDCVDSIGCGTVFKMTPAGSLTTLYTFCAQANCTDGENPVGLVRGADGNFYGTTEAGGVVDSICEEPGSTCGTVFKITPAGSLTTLYNFCSQPGCTDGNSPFAPLVQGTDGNFYGSTYFGGDFVTCPSDPDYAPGGCGTVFKITPSGALTTLHIFCTQTNCPDGSFPAAALIEGADGNFYGTTQFGGANREGTVFKITPSGTLTTLYSFCSETKCPDGSEPYAGLAQGADGNFYGTTVYGGHPVTNAGTAFKITPDGTLTRLYTFGNANTGAAPYGGLVQDTDGGFYGTTVYGGSCGWLGNACGTVFSLVTGLGPFVKTLYASGTVGAAVDILGTDLTGATSVSFNGTAAIFTVASPTLIETTVPQGATTGYLQVVTPGGTLSSNVPFRVIP